MYPQQNAILNLIQFSVVMKKKLPLFWWRVLLWHPKLIYQ